MKKQTLISEQQPECKLTCNKLVAKNIISSRHFHQLVATCVCLLSCAGGTELINVK